VSTDLSELPNLDPQQFQRPSVDEFVGCARSTHAPRLLTIPNQSSVAKAFLEFDEAGRMKPSAYYDRMVDVMEELVKFTLLTRDVSPYLVDRYSERRESALQLSKRVNQRNL
jgi:hypothetical protein